MQCCLSVAQTPDRVLTAQFVAPAVRTCLSNKADKIHFVTHSMGGVLVRQLAKSATDIRIGRVVMFPPKHGSEVVDRLGDLSLFSGSTDQRDCSSPLVRIPCHEPRLEQSFEVGMITVIARSIRFCLS